MKGLYNIGNTCYLNSALQMIIQNEDFCTLILNNKNKSEILNNISNFILEYYNDNNNTPISPIIIKNIVENKYEIFKGFKQHDATEFLIYLFDIISNELQSDNLNIWFRN